ncbi:MAG: glycosylase [Lachnospiraceae bacterium]|nr:glycosylase [Lachnospiraceae bacterium]
MAKWLDNAIFYEIYPQSFKDTNSDGVGDISGIILSLDYIKDLGCNALWLNPCFTSPFMDAGYDVQDYYTVAPRYGTNEDLKKLFEEAHKRGMHVLLDLVPGHTSVYHPWFKESMKPERNEYSDRYIWTDTVWESPEGMGCLSGISDRDGTVALNFFSGQPALNYGFYKVTKPWQQPMDAPGPRATLEAMKDIMRFWLSMGADGFRVDMAGSLVKQDEDSKGIIALWQEVRAFLDAQFPESVLISEWGEPDKSLQGGFHMDFLLHFGPSHYNDLFRCEHPFFSSEGKGDVSAFVNKYLENYQKSERKGLICIPSGNHDMDRLARTLSQEEMKIAFAFLLSMPGAPFIYYGDEIGMRYVENLISVEGGYNRTGARSPMQWDDSTNAGFSSASKDKLYIKQDESPDRPTVKAQMEDASSLYHEVKKLIALRQSHPALQSKGEIDFTYYKENAYPLAYVRSHHTEKILVVINPSSKQVEIPLTHEVAEVVYSCGGVASISDGKLICPGGSATFFLLA